MDDFVNHFRNQSYFTVVSCSEGRQDVFFSFSSEGYLEGGASQIALLARSAALIRSLPSSWERGFGLSNESTDFIVSTHSAEPR